jgi:2-amino-4-hydroxy-6-hydroxymethyldihydropteridine diphosphokinase
MQTCPAIEGFCPMRRAFVIGLGSNLGERERFLALGVTRIAAWSEVDVGALSRVFETDALGPPQPRYLNAAVRVTCDVSADALLDRLLAIETALGRTRTLHWGPRVLDLDILWGSERSNSPRLTIPHARLRERTFALAPLLDVAPELAPEYAPLLATLGGEPSVVGQLRWFAPSTCECASADIV